MSFSAPQSKMPSPVRTPRVSVDEARASASNAAAARAHKPAGITNMGMTCFLNSTFQALSATPAIVALLSNNPALPLVPVPGSLLPPPAQAPHLTPCLGPDALEPPLYPLLPVTRAFTNSLHKAWTTKDRGGGTSGAGESSSIHCISLSQLLREMARKYDQYDEFSQQDAHELLRHLLDSMEMEEKDVIKKKHPNMIAATPRPIPSTPTTPRLQPTGLAEGSMSPLAHTLPVSPGPSGMLFANNTGGGEERMLPFVDLLFGGLLASVVVCDSCRSVSHTYEGFLDLSLGMRGDDDTPRPRKRDRFRAMASRLKPRVPKDSVGVMSEPEGSDTEDIGQHHHHHHPPRARSRSRRRRELELEDGGAALSRAGSSAKSLKASFSFRRKTPKSTPVGMPAASPVASPATIPPGSTTPTPQTTAPPSPLLSPRTERTETSPQAHTHRHQHTHQATPTPAQTAYIARILYGPPAAPEVLDPLAKLRAAHAGGLAAANGTANGHGKEYGLIESLRAFTSVETLEGDNAFACHKCWKIKNGHYRERRGARSEQSAWSAPVSTHPSALQLPSIAVDETEAEPLLPSGAQTPPTSSAPATASTTPIAVSPASSSSILGISGVPVPDMSRFGRLMSRGRGGVARASSPLRQLLETSGGGSGGGSNSSSAGESPALSVATGESGDALFSPRIPTSPLARPIDISRMETIASVDSSISAATTETVSTVDTIDSVATSSSYITVGSGSSTSITDGSVTSTSNGKDSDTADDEGEGCEDGEGEGEDAAALMEDEECTTSSDGLSDSTHDEELPSGTSHFFRPRLQRRPTKHFVLRRAYKRYMIAKAPEVLVLHLKRFKQDGGGIYSTFSSLKKLDDMVTFPETLNLAPYMAPNRTDFKCVRTPEGLRAPYMDWPAPDRPPEPVPMMYNLYAVVVHMGTMLSGHYIAYVLVDPEKVFLPPGDAPPAPAPAPLPTPPTSSADDGAASPPKDRRVWCYCSDTTIRLASLQEVLAARAYLCFYEKVPA